MTKSVSAARATYIDGEVTSEATLWRVTRRDGTVFTFTDHDADIIMDVDDPVGKADELTYTSDSGYTRTAINNSADLAVDTVDISSNIDPASQSVTEQDLRAGLWDFARVEMFAVNYLDLSQGIQRLRTGFLGEVNLQETIFLAELRGLVQLLAQTIGETYSPGCRADLGDVRCKVVLVDATETTEVSAVAADNKAITVPTGHLSRQDFDVDPADFFFKVGTQVDSVGKVTLLRRATIEDGSFRNPFLVSSTTDLTNVRDDLNAWYALANDINMAGFGLFTPIGTIAAPWKGGFDGRGHVISNLDLDHSAAPLTEEIGLFGRVVGGTILRRIGLVGIDVDNGATSTIHKACLVGLVSSPNTLIEDCYVDNSSTGNVETGGDRAGGLVGLIQDSATMRRCWAATPFTGALGSRVGGLVGEEVTSFGAVTFGAPLVQDTTVGITNLGLNITAAEVTAAATSVLQTRSTWLEPTFTNVVIEGATKQLTDLLPSRTTAFFDFLTVWNPPVPATSYPDLRQWY